MTRFHAGVGRRLGSLILLGLLIVASLVISGCFTITRVDAPSGPPSPAYTVVVDLVMAETEFPEEEPEDGRGVFAVRFPGEWKLLSATYTGVASGKLIYSPAITEYYDSAWQGEGTYPGVGYEAKPGYEWWAGYSSVQPGSKDGSIRVTLVFDQRNSQGAFSLDFATGVTDPDSPNDPEAPGSWWDFGGVAVDQPVFTGVASQNVSPRVFVGSEADEYTAAGRPVVAEGGLFDPDSDAPTLTVEYGDGQSEELSLEPTGFYLNLWAWQWKHVWEANGTYTVTLRASDGESEGETTATVNVGVSPFRDVSADHDFFPAIVSLWSEGVISGYADGNFGLYDPVLRAQLAKMTVSAAGYHDEELTNLESPTFSDVSYTGDPYPFDYVEEAAWYHFMWGFADETFRPWEQLTRIQLIRTIVRSQQFFLEDPPEDYRLPFGDVPDADVKYVSLAHFNGLVQGKTDTRFDPYGHATRGHVAKILFGALSIDFPDELPPQAVEEYGRRAAGESRVRRALSFLRDGPSWMPRPLGFRLDRR